VSKEPGALHPIDKPVGIEPTEPSTLVLFDKDGKVLFRAPPAEQVPAPPASPK
jgi:hypothetical protein